MQKKHLVIRKEQLPAGDFSIWLRRARKALKHASGIEVPCGGCNACCRSSLFIPVRPDETETKKQIPAKYLFPAPGLPKGTLLLGYFKNGCCPMVVAGCCSIYFHRPLTCRSFDCRILAATGIDAATENGATEIFRQSRRWHFIYADHLGRKRLAAVKEAARFLLEHGADIPVIGAHAHPFRVAVAAVKAYKVFMTRAASQRITLRRVERELALFAS